MKSSPTGTLFFKLRTYPILHSMEALSLLRAEPDAGILSVKLRIHAALAIGSSKARVTFLSSTATDNVSTDTVDRSIEIVETVVYAFQRTATNNSTEQFHCRIIHNGYVVGIPTNPTAYAASLRGNIKAKREDTLSATLSVGWK